MGHCVELVMVLGCSMNVLERGDTLRVRRLRFFDAVPSINYIAGKEIVGLKPNLWNKDKMGAWCKYLGKNDYGIK